MHHNKFSEGLSEAQIININIVITLFSFKYLKTCENITHYGLEKNNECHQ